MQGRKPITILLVDDDVNAAEILASMLEIGFPHARIHHAANGRSGLSAVQNYAPDIIITDINMPEMDGITMLNIVSATRPGTGIIVITAHSDRHYLEQVTATGLECWLVSKPVDFALLFASLEQCIASR